MSESIWCNVRVKVPNGWNGPEKRARYQDAMVPTPPAIVADLAEALINGSGPDVDDQGDGWTVWTVDGEGNYGLSDDDVAAALGWLRDHQTPYSASSDPKYEFGGTVVVFDGTTEHEREAGESGVVALSVWTYEALAKQHATPDGLLAAIEGYFALPALEACAIDRLPAEYPDED